MDDVRIDKTYKNVGRRSTNIDFSREDRGLPAGRFLLLIHWPLRWSEVDVLAEKKKSGSTNRTKFATDLESSVALLQTYQVDRRIVPEAIALGTSHIRVADVGADETIQLRFTIDTDTEAFCKDVDDAAKAKRSLFRQIEYIAVPYRTAGGLLAPKNGVLRLVLPQARLMPQYPDLVAIDFGTSGTTMACHDGNSIKIIKLEGTLGAIDSALRIYPPANPRTSAQKSPDIWSKFVIGQRARVSGDGPTNGDSLFLGLKRHLVDSDQGKPFNLTLGRQEFLIEKREPAVRFLQGIFRIFHESQTSVPRRIVITCPTTFSHWEEERLRLAVIRAWALSLRLDPATAAERFPKLPQHVLDEASAGGFFLFANDHLNAPGGVDAFQYLYPDGLNMLIFDYGGGTTDIALVHAKAEYRTTERDQSCRLSIRILGRTGHRGFGGDDMTLAVYRVLKAKLAALTPGGERLALPALANDVRTFLDRNAKEIDNRIPTFFDATDDQNLQTDEVRKRRELVLLIWEWAEEIKKGLGGDQPFQAMSISKPFVNAVLSRIAEKYSLSDETVNKRFVNLPIRREEVDVQIIDQLDRSINNANHLIRARQDGDEIPGGEVHSVYIIGNASKYKLVEERIRSQLRVRFINDRIRPIADDDDLKNAVVKGALTAFHLASGYYEGLDVDFDGRRVDRLPYDITAVDLRRGGKDNTGHDTLFYEHTPYDKLPDEVASIPVPIFPESTEQNDRKTIKLYRRWPGERPEEFLVFKFEKPLIGPIINVRFDSEERNFVMQDQGDLEKLEVFGDPLPTAPYQAHEQGGKI